MGKEEGKKKMQWKSQGENERGKKKVFAFCFSKDKV